MNKDKKGKQFPSFENDEAVEEFVEMADLSEYDFSGFKTMSFELKPKDKRVNLRLPESLLEMIKQKAARQGVPYQRYIRHLIEQDIRH